MASTPPADELAAARAQRRRRAPAQDASWLDQLLQGNNGPLKNIANVRRALELASEFKGALAFDEMRHDWVLLRETPAGGPGPGSDQIMRKITVWVQEQGFNVGLNIVTDGVNTVAGENSFHSLRQYLGGLEWDRLPRIDSWLNTYCGAYFDDYTRAVGSKWLISAVARAMKPGCKADYVLVLEGAQGRKKSTTFAILGGEWFTDQISEFNSKDASMEATRWWIIELAELDVLQRTEASSIKAFLSRQSERLRLPYGRAISNVPRSCVFGGSVNPDGLGYMKDPTGGRRFWPVETAGELLIDALEKDRDQIWAEAVHRYKAGDKWWLSPSEESLARKEQQGRYTDHSWFVPVAHFVEGKQKFTLHEVLTSPNGLGFDNARITRSIETTVGGIVKQLGFRKVGKGADGHYEPDPSARLER